RDRGAVHPPHGPLGPGEAAEGDGGGGKGVRGPDRKAVLGDSAVDTFESLMGDQIAIRMYFQGVSRTKHVGNLGIGLLKPGLLVSSEILNMMDSYFRI